MVTVEEIGDYSEDKIIIYKQKNEKRIVSQSFTYKIITVKKYLDKMILQVTHASNHYSISDSYKIQIRLLHCIQYGKNFNEQVFFKLLATNAADLLYKKFTENKAKTSGILLFGLQLNKLKEYQKMKSVKLHAKILKLASKLTTSGLTK
ncbi:unnamed protein product [Rhizophagus irregularis]|uniref:Uncharacterized protein n=1 Tax=Rhizophagus irregularis TaxID=588596 RepID=A0A915ZL33_9GLOM|nr:unnamed protein product [Rhizophagus irregularis]CAB5381778.1 unnamed protein product [Rhizophagus irregularis]